MRYDGETIAEMSYYLCICHDGRQITRLWERRTTANKRKQTKAQSKHFNACDTYRLMPVNKKKQLHSCDMCETDRCDSGTLAHSNII